MKKIFLTILICSLTQVMALEKIGVTKTSTSSGITSEETASFGSGILGDALQPLGRYREGPARIEGEERERVKLEFKPNKNIKYRKGFDAYSVIPHDQDALKDWLRERGILPIAFDTLFGYADTRKELMTSAMGYDWGKEDPASASVFYDLIVENFPSSLKFGDKIIAADFYFRTGQIKKVKRVLPVSTCSSMIKGQHICHYYRGLAIYLETGKNRNSSLKIASQVYKTAKFIYRRGN